ncbi:hypothetical protein HPB47_027863 [Ixodes persulcatus]|uniref:Uncharacterized protein n=1 Tax=Ixodes persulcatus TaxID=34615 RepID=A0AC60PUY6_IXOPE|nr:hypothetical protein HPB47_027863 [Ixodes persulcatus]
MLDVASLLTIATDNVERLRFGNLIAELCPEDQDLRSLVDRAEAVAATYGAPDKGLHPRGLPPLEEEIP